MTPRRFAIALLGMLVAVPARAEPARAEPARAEQPPTRESMEMCVAAADRAQLARDERRLIEARRDFVTCAAAPCPLVLRRDCAKWLEDVGTRLPGIVVSVRDEDDHDRVDVQVFVDGKLLTQKLDGRLLPVDPGEHVFRFEPSGRPPTEQHLLVREGETNRLVNVRLPRVVAPSVSDVPGERSRPVPVLSLGLAGLGVVGVGAFAFFASGAKSDLQGLRDTCGPSRTCAASDVDGVRQRLLVANVALGIGVAALLGAAWLYFARGEAR